jgi:hypothetical protein
MTEPHSTELKEARSNNGEDRLKRLAEIRKPRFLVALLAATLITGVATALLDVRIGLGVVGALAMFIIGLQFELLFATSADTEEADVLLRDLAPIIAVRRRDQASGDFLLKLAEAQESYLESGRRLQAFDAELTEERKRLLRRYEECSRGSMRIDLRPASVLRETDAIAIVTDELMATSLVNPTDYWDSALGMKYLREQEARLKNGATIRRVFLELDSSLAPLCNVVNQHMAWKADKLDADCRIALIGKVQPHLIQDFAVIDRRTVIRLETPRGLDVPSFAVWETDPEVAESQLRSFRQLWDESLDPAEFSEFGHSTV